MGNLRNRNGLWMESTIEFDELGEDGVSRIKKEKYVVEATTFTDGESRLVREMEYNNRHVKVTAMLKPKYETICFSDDPNAANWYKSKVIVKEETEIKTRGGFKTKSKDETHFHLIQASNVDDARNAIQDVIYNASMEDYEISDIVKTNIVDVLEYEKHLNKFGK